MLKSLPSENPLEAARNERALEAMRAQAAEDLAGLYTAVRSVETGVENREAALLMRSHKFQSLGDACLTDGVDPGVKYNQPVLTSHEYGWRCPASSNARPNLEMFGVAEHAKKQARAPPGSLSLTRSQTLAWLERPPLPRAARPERSARGGGCARRLRDRRQPVCEHRRSSRSSIELRLRVGGDRTAPRPLHVAHMRSSTLDGFSHALLNSGRAESCTRV